MIHSEHGAKFDYICSYELAIFPFHLNWRVSLKHVRSCIPDTKYYIDLSNLIGTVWIQLKRRKFYSNIVVKIYSLKSEENIWLCFVLNTYTIFCDRFSVRVWLSILCDIRSLHGLFGCFHYFHTIFYIITFMIW